MNLKTTISGLMLFLLIGLAQNVAAQLSVTIDLKAGRPNNSPSPVVYTAVFSAPINVATFTALTIALSGTATGKAVSAITQVAPNNGTTFEVTVTANNANGTTVIASIPAGVALSSSTIGSTGSVPRGVQVDGSKNVYAINQDGTITKITSAGVVINPWATTGSEVYNFIIDASGNLYTTNYSVNQVSKITPAGVVTVFASTGAEPFAITIDAAGNVYTANRASKNVSKITPAGVSTIIGTTESNPLGIVVDGSGNVYVSNYASNNVSKITPTGVSTIFGATGTNPFGITIDASGNIYTANSTSSDVSKITAAGVSTIAFATGFNGPIPINIDGFGNIYVGNYNSNYVSKITPDGTASRFANCGNNPLGLTIDASGNIFTANQNSQTVTKITIPVGIALSGSNTPSNAASTSTNNTYTLPVTLLSFTAVKRYCGAMLAWQTTAEINRGNYAVEVSTNGSTFIQVAKLASKNSATGANYTFTSADLTSATTYYRLKMEDTEGHYTHSKTVVVTANGNCSTYLQPTISPNPASDFITVEGLIKGSKLALVNAAGIQLLTLTATNSNQRIDISKYAKGVYALHITTADGGVRTLKVVK